MNNFNVIYLLSGGNPVPVGDSAGKTDLLITWLYKLTVDKNDYNLGAVIGIMTFIVLAVVSLITYRNSGSYKNGGGIPMSRHSGQTIQTTARMKRPESHGLMHDAKKRRILGDVLSYLFLGVMAIIWLIPIVWVFAESFNKNTAPYTKTFFPTEFSLDNYITLFTDRSVLNFPKMFMNTFIVACFVCLISVVFVLSVAYCMSRMRFRTRKTFMNVVLVLGMFPGIMAVSAIYFILKAVGLTSEGMTPWP